MQLYPKFIIETLPVLGNCIILSQCARHYQLVTNSQNVKGGGWFLINNETNTITLHGKSDEFGQASLDDIKTCINNGNVFTSPQLLHPIADKYNFNYNSETEIINLKSMEL